MRPFRCRGHPHRIGDLKNWIFSNIEQQSRNMKLYNDISFGWPPVSVGSYEEPKRSFLTPKRTRNLSENSPFSTTLPSKFRQLGCDWMNKIWIQAARMAGNSENSASSTFENRGNQRRRNWTHLRKKKRWGTVPMGISTKNTSLRFRNQRMPACCRNPANHDKEESHDRLNGALFCLEKLGYRNEEKQTADIRIWYLTYRVERPPMKHNLSDGDGYIAILIHVKS